MFNNVFGTSVAQHLLILNKIQDNWEASLNILLIGILFSKLIFSVQIEALHCEIVHLTYYDIFF